MFYSFDKNKHLEQKVAHFQIKSQKKLDIKDGFVHKSIKSKDIQTWLHYLGPVFLIVVDVSTNSIYWTYIEKHMATTTLNSTIKIPTSNQLDSKGIDSITSIKNTFS